jgi:ribonuclease-3
MRSAIAKEESLAGIAREISLGDFLLLGKGETECGGKNRDSTLSDAFESLVGALYLDAGIEAAQNFLLALVQKMYPEPSDLLADLNPKGSLQEYTQQHLGATPEYVTVMVSGPDHSPSYTVEVFIKSKPMGQGSATKRKAAEGAAAKVALENLLAKSKDQEAAQPRK